MVGLNNYQTLLSGFSRFKDEQELTDAISQGLTYRECMFGSEPGSILPSNVDMRDRITRPVVKHIMGELRLWCETYQQRLDVMFDMLRDTLREILQLPEGALETILRYQRQSIKNQEKTMKDARRKADKNAKKVTGGVDGDVPMTRIKEAAADELEHMRVRLKIMKACLDILAPPGSA